MEILGGEDDGYWGYQQLRSRGNTIEAGTSEILRNIIAERVLGLPGAADAIRLHGRPGAAAPRGARRACERRLETRRARRARLSSTGRCCSRRPGAPTEARNSSTRTRPSTNGSPRVPLEAAGIARRALDFGIEHAKTREQFGRPIGVYQAVSHPLADTYVETELARSLAYWAAWCVAEEDEQTAIAVAAAKSLTGEVAVAACERAIQVLGGIGFTWEHPLHKYYKRAQWIQAYGGYPREQRAKIAAWLLD